MHSFSAIRTAISITSRRLRRRPKGATGRGIRILMWKLERASECCAKLSHVYTKCWANSVMHLTGIRAIEMKQLLIFRTTLGLTLMLTLLVSPASVHPQRADTPIYLD